MYIRNGLSLGPPETTPTTPTPPPSTTTWWQELVGDLSRVFGEAAASRIKYGEHPPYPSGVYASTENGAIFGGAWGGFDPTSLVLVGGLIIGGVVLAKAVSK